MLYDQFLKIKFEIASSKVKSPVEWANENIFIEVRNKVSTYCLQQLYNQYKMAKDNKFMSVCTNSFSSNMGLLCHHKIRNIILSNSFIKLKSVSSFWYIEPTNTIVNNFQYEGEGGNLIFSSRLTNNGNNSFVTYYLLLLECNNVLIVKEINTHSREFSFVNFEKDFIIDFTNHLDSEEKEQVIINTKNKVII
jgi:hypothetical protein